MAYWNFSSLIRPEWLTIYQPVIDEIIETALNGNVDDLSELVSILLDRERLIDMVRD